MTDSTSQTTWRVPEPGDVAVWARQRWAALNDWLAISTNRWLLAGLLVALFARLTILDLAPFGPEQAGWLAMGRALAAPAGEAVEATTYFGDRLSPGPLGVISWLGAAISGEAKATFALLALLHMIALTVFGLRIARHVNATAGVLAALFLGLGTWPILDACNLTPASFTLPLALLLFAALLSAVIERNGWAWGVSALIAILAIVNDPAALSLPLIWLGTLIFYHDRVRWGGLLAGAALALLLAYASDPGELVVNLFISSDTTAEQPYLERLLNAGTEVASYLAGQRLERLSAPSEPGAFATAGLLGQFRALVGLLVWITLPWSAVQAVQSWSHWQDRDKGPERTLLALWLWIPMLFAPRLDATTAVTARIVAPAAAATIGALLAMIGTDMGRPELTPWRWAWLALLLACGGALAVNLYSGQAVPRFAHVNDASIGYGIPYRNWQKVGELVERGVSRSEADQLWITASGKEADTAKLYLANAVFVAPDGQLLPVGRPGLYLQWRDDPDKKGLLERLGAREIGAVPWPDGRQAVVFQLRQRTAEELLELVPQRPTVRYDAGLMLVGYDWPPDAAAGQQALLVTYWTMDGFSSRDQDSAAWISLAILSETGEQLAWSGPLALDGAYWQEGLLLRQEVTMDVPATWPPGSASLVAEVRRTPTGDAVPVLDASARPGHATAELGTVWIN